MRRVTAALILVSVLVGSTAYAEEGLILPAASPAAAQNQPAPATRFRNPTLGWWGVGLMAIGGALAIRAIQWDATDKFLSLGQRSQVATTSLLCIGGGGLLIGHGFRRVPTEPAEIRLSDRPSVSADRLVPRRIGIGQTMGDVEAQLGKPDTVANVGAKTVYTYKNLKIVFTDGRVSDIE